METFAQLLMVLFVGSAVLYIAWGDVMLIPAGIALVGWIVVRQRIHKSGASRPSQ